MGHQVIWTNEAIADLQQLVAYISQVNPTAAVKLGEKFIPDRAGLVARRTART